MELSRRLSCALTAGTLVVALGGCAAAGGSGDDSQVPRFVVDPVWPMPLQYPFILGAVTGVAVGPGDNVFIVTRQDRFTTGTEIGATLDIPGGECCIPSPAVIEFDSAGTPLRQWGGPGAGYTWFRRPHGIAVDPQGNVWIGGSGNPPSPPAAPGGRGAAAAGGGGGRGGGAAAPPSAGEPDTHILKFSRYGTLLSQIGRANAPLNSSSNNSFGGVARIDFDVLANEAYVADVYFHRRVVVLDMTSGAVKRFWGAYGNAPSDADIGPYDPSAPPAQQFRTVTCAVPSSDGFVYVCDRGNNRIQVFTKSGAFVSEKVIAPNTRGAVAAGLSKDRGSVWDIALSPDSSQRFLYVADGMNERVYILDRASLEVRTSFGVGGRYPSHFLAVGSLAVDSRGNIYTGEDEEGKRVQKFDYLGMGPVTAEHQGAVWPATTP